MAESTWENREVRLLEEVRAIEAEQEEPGAARRAVPRLKMLADRLDMPMETVSAGMRALATADPPYITGADASTWGGFDILDFRLTERGRRAVGQWPSDHAYDAMLQTLTRQIQDEPQPDKRQALEKIRDGVLVVGREVGTGVLTAWIRSVTGLPG